jgi:hypothetical protein
MPLLALRLGSSYRRPGGLHELIPTVQCQPVLRPWLQPGGLVAGPRVRTCARAAKSERTCTFALVC